MCVFSYIHMYFQFTCICTYMLMSSVNGHVPSCIHVHICMYICTYCTKYCVVCSTLILSFSVRTWTLTIAPSLITIMFTYIQWVCRVKLLLSSETVLNAIVATWFNFGLPLFTTQAQFLHCLPECPPNWPIDCEE